MPRFLIRVPCECFAGYLVTAENLDSAVDAVLCGYADFIGYNDYDENYDRHQWFVETEEEDRPAAPNLRIIVWHGENASIFYVVKDGVPNSCDDWEIIDSFSYRESAEKFIANYGRNNNVK